MPTNWTNPVAPGEPIRAFDIREVREAINGERTALGWCSCPFTDDALPAGAPIKALHFTEMRASTQILWNFKSMGPIPGWTQRGGADPSPGMPIYADDLNDLRAWVNQYQAQP